QKLYANIVGGQISKRQRLTNWERPVLTTAQQLYAATDAWACVVLYREIKRLLDTGEYVLIRQDDGSEDVAP
ncbi:MAG: 3'-5' exonuclease domain-containing protein 2, partial [Prevotellaceae bacterium]|nr:3'-5' exonuclease domain-containing protein 2 [Prevotellaceae bacterium]